MSQPTLFPSRGIRIAAVLVLFLTALSIRLYDLTDPPLDFHPTRQLLSAIKARALYFEIQPEGYTTEQFEIGRRQARLKAQVEPVMLEHLVAFTYRFTGEQLWVARIYSSLFWLIGGMLLFLLVRDLISFDAAIVSAAYYLFFPYAILASRSFQPDPLMVMLILAFWWTFARWLRFPSWTYAILAGVVGGAAILIKFSAAFFVIGAAFGLFLSHFPWRDLFRNGQVWAMAILGALPGIIYLIYGVFIQGGLQEQFSGRFVPALLVNPLNYLQWMVKADIAAGGLFIMLALLGFFLTGEKNLRGLVIGLWTAYLLYSLFFNYHAATHDYYQLPFIPIVALSLGPLGRWFFVRLAEGTLQGVRRTAVYAILLLGLFMVVWNVRNQMKAVDYRPEAAMWTEIGERVGDGRIVALAKDYGSPLEYWGWKTALVWPDRGDTVDAGGDDLSTERLFRNVSSRRDLFLVTDFEELDRQPALEQLLKQYPVIFEGDGFVIYDLRALD